jgi:hypothetical protein
MFEVIGEALIWIMSWVLDRRPHGGEAFRLLLLISFTAVATWLAIYWRDLAYRSPTMRRKLLPNERYAGRYLQAVWRGDEVRYAIVNIYFNRAKKRFEIAGRTYNPEGDALSSFKSAYVLFPAEKDDNIEFIWQGTRADSGYTRMTVEGGDENFVQGVGFVMRFDANKPKAYPLRFKHLHTQFVKDALGVHPPAKAVEEPEFVKKFHGKYGEAAKAGLAAEALAEREDA